MCFFLPPPSLYTIMFQTPLDSCAVHLISVPAFIHTCMHVLLVIQAWSFLVLWFFDWNSVAEWYKLIKSSLYSSHSTIVSFNSFFGCTIGKWWSQTSELFFWHKEARIHMACTFFMFPPFPAILALFLFGSTVNRFWQWLGLAGSD